MKIKQQVKGSDHAIFIAYDETQTCDEEADARKRVEDSCIPAHGKKAVYRDFVEWQKKYFGNAYGHPKLAYITVHRDGRQTFQLDNEITYSADQLKKLMSLSRLAQRRVKFRENNQA